MEGEGDPNQSPLWEGSYGMGLLQLYQAILGIYGGEMEEFYGHVIRFKFLLVVCFFPPVICGVDFAWLCARKGVTRWKRSGYPSSFCCYIEYPSY